MKKIQNGPALASDRAVERVPDGPVNGVVDGVQAGDGDQRSWRTTQFGRKVEFPVVDHGGGRRCRRHVRGSERFKCTRANHDYRGDQKYPW